MQDNQAQLRDLLVQVSQSSDFYKITHAYFAERMAPIYGLGSGFDEDLRGIVVMNLLERIESETFVFQDQLDASSSETNHFYKMLKWLVEAFKNECRMRIRSRLPKNNPDARGGDKMLYGSSFRESDYAGGLAQEDSAFSFDSLEETDHDESVRHFEGNVALERFVKAVGVDNASVVTDYLAGFSNVELAKKYGGSPDKYRVMFKRALKKLESE